ncbi:MAG: hypothetical protein QOJ98_469 [Acidobacteriota bacterium]|jgi:hypothetical protein|nr:hypothetical protein [Acidobacteriota bacterium]
MIRKSDWDDAHRELLADGRERFEPPDPEQVEALLRGDLPDAEAERVREALAYYPEVLQVMTTSFEEEGEVLTADERAADLAKIRARVQPRAAAAILRPERWQPTKTMAIAAGFVIAIAISGVVFWRAHPQRNAVTKVLYADGDRGGATRGLPDQPPIELSASTDYVLKPVFRPDRSYREYRFELFALDTASPRPLWSRSGVQRQQDGSYPVELSTEKLSPGRYELVLYGVDGHTERLATYTIRIDAP